MLRARDKVLDRPSLAAQVRLMQSEGRKVVFTNGCFDLIHPGHVRYLEAARALGDALVVAVNADASVIRLKGPGRPIQVERDRCEVLAALAAVDFVATFGEDTPWEIISEVQPDILVKGGDWTVDRIVGRDLVEARGGAVLSIPFEAGFSTTGIVRRILAHAGCAAD